MLLQLLLTPMWMGRVLWRVNNDEEKDPVAFTKICFFSPLSCGDMLASSLLFPVYQSHPDHKSCSPHLSSLSRTHKKGTNRVLLCKCLISTHDKLSKAKGSQGQRSREQKIRNLCPSPPGLRLKDADLRIRSVFPDFQPFLSFHQLPYLINHHVCSFLLLSTSEKCPRSPSITPSKWPPPHSC